MENNFNDIRVLNNSQEPKDTVQDIIWSSNNGMFAVGGWDGYLRIYTINSVGIGSLEMGFSMFLGDPVISLAWDEENNVVFAGMASGVVKAVELKTGNIANVLTLSAPICKVFWIRDQKVLVTVPFDKCIYLNTFVNQGMQKEIKM